MHAQLTPELTARLGRLTIKQAIRSKHALAIRTPCDIPTIHITPDIISFLHTRGCRFSPDIGMWAARHGHLDMVAALFNLIAPWDEACEHAAQGGHLRVLQWLRAHGCPWGMTCAGAAKGGHLGVLQWARANQCPWDRYTCVLARQHGNLDVVNWARDNGCTDYVWV